MTFESCYIEVEGVTWHYMHHPNPGKPLLVFLHGFPEAWFSWEGVMQQLADDYALIAPDLPGYNLSAKPDDLAFYRVPNLIANAARFIDTVSPEQSVVLVAHDWGGAIAWPLAAFHPKFISQLVILNAAHPSTFTREMLSNSAQQQKSEYINQLIADDAEKKVKADNFAFLRKMRFVQPADKAEVERYVQGWQRPGALTAMLNYYRAMPQHPSSDDEKNQQARIPNIRINCPTMVLWGDRDDAFVTQILDGLEGYVPDLTIKRFADATHWLQHEKPDEVGEAIKAFVR